MKNKIKNICLKVFVFSGFALFAAPSFAGVSVGLDVGVVLGGYHRDPAVRAVYVDHRSPYVGIGGNVELTDEDPVILPYTPEDGCIEFCDDSYVVVDQVRIGGALYPYSSVVVLNRRGTRVRFVRPINDIARANVFRDRVVAIRPMGERVTVRHGWFGPRLRERNAFVVGRGALRPAPIEREPALRGGGEVRGHIR